jgi:hypothetical protein
VGLSRPLPSSWPGGRVSARNPPTNLYLKRLFFNYKLITKETHPAESDFTGQIQFICVRRNLGDYANLSAEFE